ncbi:MAG: virulence-associated protein E, partial [Bacillota bacterium]|nr:virulence-associated protein E [Bacillota bacterium]
MDSILADLDVSENNQVKGSLENCMKILKRDPLLKGAISKNELTCREDIVKPMPWKRTGAT